MLLMHAISGGARPRLLSFLFAALAILAAAVAIPAPVMAQADNPSGLPLPRFVSTRSNPINVRVGPGTKYEISWNYLVSAVPVEIIQEFDTWRKIRDADGSEGWVHQSLLVGTRLGYAAPLVANGEVSIRANRSDEARVRARLGPGAKVGISACDGQWCEVSASQPGERSNYTGFVRQEELWGVYPDEVFD